MAKYIPVIVVAAILLVMGGALYVGMRPAPPPSEPPTPPQPVATPTAEKPAAEAEKPAAPAGIAVEGAEIEQRDPQGKLEWKVTAGGELEFDKDRQTITGKQVKFEIVSTDRLPCVINAPVFHADYGARKLVFDQGVSGHMTDGSAQFRVNHLSYNFDTSKLIGTGGARFIQGAYSASANEIILDAKAKKVRMRGGVRFEKRG